MPARPKAGYPARTRTQSILYPNDLWFQPRPVSRPAGPTCRRSAAAFNLIRWAGVAYLAYLGLRAFRAGRPEAPPGVPGQPVPLARSARKGLIVGLGNPKMVIFYVAFFPQFIHPAQGSQAIQMLILGAVFWVIGAVWDLAFASASGMIGNWLRRRPRIRAAQPRVEGLAYLGLAVWTGSSS